MSRHRAFTLVELLVVLAIIVLVAAMVGTVSGADGRAAGVRLAAEQVAAMLKQARALALATHEPHAVSFNIQNEPGSSGAVINNRSGGHWCRILRSARYGCSDLPHGTTYTFVPPILPGIASGSGRPAGDPYATFNPQVAEGNRGGENPTPIYPTFAHLAEEIRSCWIGEALNLPAKRVRFLALGDADEGPRWRIRNWDTNTLSENQGYGATYPRPYFGWVAAGANGVKWHPWGGYAPSIPFSGLVYQGKGEPAIPDSRHPAQVDLTVQWNDWVGSTTSTWTLFQAGDPRPLVNGDWCDFVIVFNPDGTAVFPAMKCNRRWFPAGKGPAGTAKAWSGLEAYWGFQYSVPAGESISYERHTGRTYITLAPDAPTDDDTFSSTEDVLRAIMPMYRVYVSRAGGIGVLPVRRNDGVFGDLAAQGLGSPWPPDPGDFANDTFVEQNYRFGWLHAHNANTSAYLGDLTPKGTPIQDQVGKSMLERRAWWTDGP